MKHSPLVFLAALIAMAGSWCGFVLAPQVQLGRSTQTSVLGTGDLYPLARPGVAAQGLEVYRANGCMYCHTQQVRQEGTRCEVVLAAAGTNSAATRAAIGSLNPELAPGGVLASLPKSILQVADVNAADPAIKALEVGGGRVEVHVVPYGPDILRGWGRRRTAAQDYLYDFPVQPGSRRIGPDLANVGLRLADANWHYRHLYAPENEVNGSRMPPYRHLFERRKVGHEASADALKLSDGLAPEAGYEIVPRPEGRALVAYLLSLRADAPLFEAPYAPVPMGAAVATNGTATNATVSPK